MTTCCHHWVGRHVIKEGRRLLTVNWSSVEQTPQIQTRYAGDGNGIPAHQQLNSITIAGPRSSILKVALDPLLSIIPRIGGSRNRGSRSQRDGIIASPRVMASSVPPSPGVYGTPLASAAGSPFGPSAASAWPQSPNLNGSSTTMMGGSSVGSLAYDPSSLSPSTPFGMRVAAHNSGNTGSPPFLRQPPSGSGGMSKRSVTSPALSLGGQPLTMRQQQQDQASQQGGRPSSPLKFDMSGSSNGRQASPPPLTFRLTEASSQEGGEPIDSSAGSASGIQPVRSVSPLRNNPGNGGTTTMSRRKVTS